LRAKNANPAPPSILEAGKLWTEYNQEPLFFLLTQIVTDQKPLIIGGDSQDGADPILRLNLADPPKEQSLADH
jgi:hypothetical protein